MIIYVSHSRENDFKNQLYVPIRNSKLNKIHKIILPHELSPENFSSKELFKDKCDLVIAEVSHKSTGVGIELGWADSFGIPIIAIHKKDIIPSRSIKSVTSRFVSYSNERDMILGIEKEMKRMMSEK